MKNPSTIAKTVGMSPDSFPMEVFLCKRPRSFGNTSVGMVSRSNVVPISSHYDTPGVLARGFELLEDVFLSMSGADPEDPDTVEAFSNMPPAEEIGEKEPVRIGFLRFPADAQDTEGDALLKKFQGRLEKSGIQTVYIEAQAMDNCYKTVTSVDIAHEMNALLARAQGPVPRSFAALVQYYREHPQARPYGMERLDDALEVIRETGLQEAHRMALDDRVRYNDRIECLCREHCVDALVAGSFIDWWAIAAAPSLAVPFAFRTGGSPFSVLIGCPRMKDRRLLAIGKRIADALPDERD